MELLGHMVVLDLGVFLFLRNLHIASQSGNTNLHSHQQCVGSLFSVSLPPFVVCGLLDDSHSYRCAVVSHCGFDLHFPETVCYWHKVRHIAQWNRTEGPGIKPSA